VVFLVCFARQPSKFQVYLLGFSKTGQDAGHYLFAQPLVCAIAPAVAIIISTMWTFIKSFASLYYTHFLFIAGLKLLSKGVVLKVGVVFMKAIRPIFNFVRLVFVIPIVYKAFHNTHENKGVFFIPSITATAWLRH